MQIWVMHFLSMKDGEQQTSQIKNWLTEAGLTLQLGQQRLVILAPQHVQCAHQEIASLNNEWPQQGNCHRRLEQRESNDVCMLIQFC